MTDGGRNTALRASPYVERQRDRNANFYDNNGWVGVAWYGDNEALNTDYSVPGGLTESPAVGVEHLATRRTAGCYDLTAHLPVEIRGASAGEFVGCAYTNDMSVDVGGVRFALLLDEQGGLVGDHIVTRLADTQYLAIASPGNEGSVEWLRDRAPVGVSVIDRGSAYAGMGLWGPNAGPIVQSMTEADVSRDAVPSFTASQFQLAGVPVTAIRISAVGEPGWELWTPTGYGHTLWDEVWAAGTEQGMTPIGDRAFASLTAENGNREWGNDVFAGDIPHQVGLDAAVDMDTDFIGKDELRRRVSEGVDRRLACLTLDSTHHVPAVGASVAVGGDRLGSVLRSVYGYSIEKPIAFAQLPPKYVEPGTSVEVATDETRHAGTIRAEPVYDTTNRNAGPRP